MFKRFKKYYFSTLLILGLLISTPLIAVKYSLINGKLQSIKTPDQTVIITDTTIADTLIAHQYQIEELESEIKKRDRKIDQLNKELNELREDYKKFKSFYFRSF